MSKSIEMTDTDAVLIAEGEVEADEATTIAAWQHLIDTGMCWRLQGWFGRTAMTLIEDGVCVAPRKVG
jgi:hypothetical protein